jgi:hypothetical protein
MKMACRCIGKQLEPLSSTGLRPTRHISPRAPEMQASIGDHKRDTKEKRLAALQTRLCQLRAECTNVERECAQLEHELGHRSARIGSTGSSQAAALVLSTNAPIHRCPNEILIQIFNYYLEPFHHYHIRRLLLVCKRWHSIVMRTKKLWARIEIDNAVDLFGIETKTSLVPYVDACFERSQDLTLDVDLNLEDFPDLDEYITTSLYTCAKSIIDYPHPRSVLSNLDDIRWNCSSQWYESESKTILNSLFGTKSRHLVRYHKLVLHLPYDDDKSAMIIAIRSSGPFPNLKYLEVHNLHKSKSFFQDSSFPSVETIKLDEDVPLTNLAVSRTSIRHLEIGFDLQLSHLAELSSFTQLHKLVLHLPEFGPRRDETYRISINLQYLAELTISGLHPWLRQVDFNLPSLNLLELGFESSFLGLPKVHPRRIVLDVDPSDMEDETEELKETMVRDIVMLSTTTQSIVFPEFLAENLVKVLTECHQKNAASSLRRVILASEKGKEDTFDPHDETQLARLVAVAKAKTARLKDVIVKCVPSLL